MNDRLMPEPDKFYSARGIIQNGFLGEWIKSNTALTQLLRTERGQEVFKPVVKQSNKYMTFKIKGQTIIDIMGMIDRGELRL